MATGEDTELEKQLFSDEQLDRNSPDLWPEKIPGLNEYHDHKMPDPNQTPKWMRNLEDADYQMLQELGCMTKDQIMDKVNELTDLSYSLGLEEAREMTRGKFLNIFPHRPAPPATPGNGSTGTGGAMNPGQKRPST